MNIHKIILYDYSPQALKLYGISKSMPLPEYDKK